MKKYIYVILIMFAATVLFAQHPQIHEEGPFQKEINEVLSLNTSTSSYLRGNSVKRLDSLVMPLTGYYIGSALKVVYEYDTINNSTAEKYYRKLDPTTPWEPTYLDEKFFDLDDNVIDVRSYRQWSTTTNTFDYGSRFQFFYNNNVRIESIELLLDASTQVWENSFRDSMHYDMAGTLTHTSRYSWSINNNQWQDLTTTVYTYNTNNLLILEEENWTNSGNPTKRKEYTYNSNGERTQLLVQNYTNGTWENRSKIDYTYSTLGQLTTIDHFNWDNSAWIYLYKYDFTYDQMNNLTTTVFYELDWGTQTLEPYDKEIYTYDNSFAHSVLQTTYNERDCRHQLLTFNRELYIGNGMFEEYFAGTYYWTDLVTAVSEVILAGPGKVLAYPNPVSDVLYVELPESNMEATIELYNVSGQRVLSTQINNNAVNLKRLPNGFYSYVIQQNGKAFSGKVIVK